MTSNVEDISRLIHSNSFYQKSIETLQANTSIDQSVFEQLEVYLSKLTNPEEELLSSETDHLSSILLFLLEHRPIEIDLNLLTSTDTRSSSRKPYKLKLVSFVQHSSESTKLLHQLCQLFHTEQLADLLVRKHNTQAIYLHCLEYLRPFLSKTTYEKYPLALQLFFHLIHSMSQASLSETFDYIFPVCLMTLDDPSIEMKFLSLSLLDHLQRNSTTTDLLLFNRANVIM